MNRVSAAVQIENFGKDHWSAFAYLACVVTGKEGVPEFQRMRCDPDRHHAFAHRGSYGSKKYPTRLKDGELADHDDWDCVDDLAVAGLVKIGGTEINPIWSLTDAGWLVSRALSDHKMSGKNFASFIPPRLNVG